MDLMATRTGVGRDLSPVKKGMKVPKAGGGGESGGAQGAGDRGGGGGERKLTFSKVQHLPLLYLF